MTRRKDGLYQEAVKLRGMGKPKYFYGKTKAEVYRKIAEFEEKQETGPLFETVAEEWWTEHEPTLSPTTARSYKPAKERAVTYFQKVFIRDIRPSDINRFISAHAKEKNAAQKTSKNQLMVVNLIFRYAVANGYADINVARDLSAPKGLPKTAREEASSDDIKRIKESTGCTFGMFAYWALYTGCRRGELLALSWEDVDIENRTITINKSVYHTGSKPCLKLPKTKAGIRELPLLDKLFEKIQPRKGLIFPNENGDYLTNSQCRNLFEKYRAESGVTCTLHQLRHAYATMLFENEVDIKDAQELLGHANASTTQDIYTHIRETRKEKIRNQLRSADIA